MKVAIVYQFGEESWSTPYSLLSEFNKRDGISASRFQLSEQGIDELISSGPYDLILVMDWKGLRFERLDKKYFPHSLFVGEMSDCPQNLHLHLPNVHKYDLLLTPAYDSHLTLVNSGHNSIYFPHWADSQLDSHDINVGHHPVRSTRGPGGSQFLDELSYIMPDKFINKNGLSGIEHARFLSGAKIVVQNSRNSEYTRRLPEAMLAGAMVLTDRLPSSTNIDSLFTEGEDIVYYDDMADCISKINWYLSPEGDAERMSIATRGHLAVNFNHTQMQRVNVLLEQLNIWKEKNS